MTPANRIGVAPLVLLSALSVCATSSTLNEKAQPAGNPAGLATVELDPGIQSLYSQFTAGFAKRAINLVMSVFDKSATLSYQDAADSNFGQIKAGFEYDFRNDPPGTTWAGFPEESHQEGNLAVVIAHWEFYALNDGKKVRQQRIRSIDVLRRTNGKWKIVRTINYPER